MIPRFSPSTEDAGMGARAIMRRDHQGEWIRYADYLGIEARVGVLEGQVKMMSADMAEKLPP